VRCIFSFSPELLVAIPLALKFIFPVNAKWSQTAPLFLQSPPLRCAAGDGLASPYIILDSLPPSNFATLALTNILADAR